MLGAPDRTRRYHEFCEWLAHITATAFLAACPECGGPVRNLAVTRE